MNKENSRDYNMDLLRILASFMVVVIHVSSDNITNILVTSSDWSNRIIYDSLVRSAVPLFLMLSGAFFLTDKVQSDVKKIYKKYIFKLFILFIIWSVVYVLFCLYTNRLDTNQAVTFIIKGHFHLWYIPVMIGIYIISPFIYHFVKNTDKKIFKYFIYLFFIASILKTIYYFDFLPNYDYIKLFLDNLPIGIICEYYSYFILGYFLYNYDISKKNAKIFYVLALICCFACYIGTYLLSLYQGNNFNLMKEFSIFTLIEAIGIFLVFKKHIFNIKDSLKKVIYCVSNCTLGIYVVHLLVMYFLFDYNIIQINSFNSFLSIPIISILVFIISFVLVYFIKKIKIIGKWLF